MTNINKAQLLEAQKTLEDRLLGIINNLAKQIIALEKANGQLETKVKEQEETIKKLSESGKAINVENWSNVVTRNTKKPVE